MKAGLVIGLGNPVMGDDGVGAAAAEALSRDPEAAAQADIVAGGTDVLRHLNQMEGRRLVVLIDAVRGDPPGVVSVVEELTASAQQHAHHLSAVDTLAAARLVTPQLADTRFVWVLVSIRSASSGFELSPELAAALPGVLERVRQELRRR